VRGRSGRHFPAMMIIPPGLDFSGLKVTCPSAGPPGQQGQAQQPQQPSVPSSPRCSPGRAPLHHCTSSAPPTTSATAEGQGRGTSPPPPLTWSCLL
jgi:hypothetical protein